MLGQVLAESEGFEPPSPCGLTVFKTAAFDRSANSPLPSEAGILPPGNRPVRFTMVEPTSGKTSLVKIYGRLGSAEAYQLRDFLHRSDVPFEWIPLESDAQARLPVCEFPDGTRMESPTIRQVTEKLGWFANPSRAEYDLAIYGAGPAGLSAAVYGSSDGLKTVLVERWAIGGQAASSPRIENYLGFPEGTSGAELAERARAGLQVRHGDPARAQGRARRDDGRQGSRLPGGRHEDHRAGLHLCDRHRVAPPRAARG